MAKGATKAPPANREDPYWQKPVAAHEPLSTRDNELGPQEFKKAARRPAHEHSGEPKNAPAKELMAYLLDSGTNPQKMANAQRWITAYPDSSAADLYRFLEEAEDRGEPAINVGTLRKAGKWLWGSAWEPETAVLQAPAEEIHRLRQQVGEYESQIAVKNTQSAGLQTRLDYLQGEVERLQRENNFLRAGRSKDDLAKAGAEPGANVLTTTPTA